MVTGMVYGLRFTTFYLGFDSVTNCLGMHPT